MLNDDHRTPHLITFSKRYGYETLPEPMRLEELSLDLRIEIWNTFWGILPEIEKFIPNNFYRLASKLMKKPLDEVFLKQDVVLGFYRSTILTGPFYKVIDLAEAIMNELQEFSFLPNFTMEIGHLFEQYPAAYFLNTSQRPYHFVPRNSKEQGEAVKQAIETIQENGLEGVAKYFQQAAENINKNRFDDSVTKSIAAVESVARKIVPNEKTLGEALKALEKEKLLTNSQLKAGFSKLYAYANTEEGVRHPLVFKDSSDVGIDEAIFMYGACASFAAYLATKYMKMQRE